ncbi:MAG: hypothetical protein ACRDVO_08190, partial [Jiangellaceae bacterium]
DGTAQRFVGEGRPGGASSSCPEGIRGRSFNTETDSPDDVGFTGALIDEITMIWGTDPDRVYATGMSNGAEIVYRLAAEMGGRLAAIAPGQWRSDGPGPDRPGHADLLCHLHRYRRRDGGNPSGRGPRNLARAGGMLRSYRPHAR